VHSEPVTWIGRDRPFGVPEPEPAVAIAPAPQAPRTRRKWTVGALAGLLILGLVTWKLLGGGKTQSPLADRGAIPLVSVIVPGQQSVTSSVSFTGAIAARYDMPIANEGDTGRIVGVYVEAGDHVKRGQLLAKDRRLGHRAAGQPSGGFPRAGECPAALSAAEYRRAQGVEAAGALSAEDIEKRRATAVTDAANVKVVAAQLAEAQARLGRTRIAAPVEGTVLTRKAEAGQIANRAVKSCSASPVAARSRCAGRSPSRTSRG